MYAVATEPAKKLSKKLKNEKMKKEIVKKVLAEKGGLSLVATYDTSINYVDSDGKKSIYDFTVSIDGNNRIYTRKSAYKESEIAEAIEDFNSAVAKFYKDKIEEESRLYKCNCCQGEHNIIEAKTECGGYSICPTTKRVISLDCFSCLNESNEWISKTEFKKVIRHFGNNVSWYKDLGIFCGSLFNYGIDNKCILFTDDMNFVVVTVDGKVISDSKNSTDIKNVIDDTLDCFQVINTGKTYRGEEERSNVYLIYEQGVEYSLTDLQRIYFSSHGSKPSPDELIKAIKILVPSKYKEYLKFYQKIKNNDKNNGQS